VTAALVVGKRDYPTATSASLRLFGDLAIERLLTVREWYLYYLTALQIPARDTLTPE
jgi:hypothetical protein